MTQPEKPVAVEVRDQIKAEQDAIFDGKPWPQRRDFLVVEEKLGDLTNRLDKMAKRASKLGVEPITYVVGDFLDEERTRELSDGSTRKYVVRRHAVRILGEAPKLNGWTFAGSLQHLDGANIVKCVLEGVTCPTEFRTVKALCAHCKTVRNRIDTHIVYHSERKEWKQVGSNCISDFLGSVSASILARQAEWLADALDATGGCEEEGFGGGRSKPRYAILTVLVQTACAIRQFGWMSRGNAKKLEEQGRGGATPTANIVERNFWDKYEYLKRDGILIEAQDGAVEEATAALDWALKISDEDVERSDYLYNIRVIAKSSSIEPRLFGFACSIVSSYQREMGKQAERALTKPSAFVGTVGERLTLTLTVLYVNSIESDFGVSHLHMFVDAEGNKFKWFGSSMLDVEDAERPGERRDVKKDDVVTIKGTVKKHEEYKGSKQTMLSRCAIFVPKAPKEKQPRRSSEEVKAEKVAKGIVKFFQAAIAPAKGTFHVCSGCNQEIGIQVADHTWNCPMKSAHYWAQGQWSRCSGCNGESRGVHFYSNDHGYPKDADGNYGPCPVLKAATWGTTPNHCSGCGVTHDGQRIGEPIVALHHMHECPIWNWATWGCGEQKCSGCGVEAFGWSNYEISRGRMVQFVGVNPNVHQYTCPLRKPEAWGIRLLKCPTVGCHVMVAGGEGHGEHQDHYCALCNTKHVAEHAAGVA